MANDPELARKLLQVFCGGAGEQQTSVFGTMKNTTPEYSTDPDVLQGTNWPQGWQNAVAADDAPFMEDMNSLFYVMSYLVKYLYQHGVAEWNNKETYTALKSIVFRNGKLYVAKQSSGADNPRDPATDSSNTYWYLALDPVNPPASQNWVQGYAQSLANLSQTIDSSTSKYPSNKAVQDAIGAIDVNISIRDYLKTVYPVGSLFFSTASTCPLQSLGIGTWNNVGTSLTLSVNTNVPVKGNGKALGITNNSLTGGLFAGNSGLILCSENNYNIATKGIIKYYPDNTIGIVPNATNSGIVGTVTRTQITVNVFQRTA